MARHEIRIERLIGQRVFALNGRPVGRIAEICAEPHGKQLAVKEYHVGTYAALESLAAVSIGRALLSLLPMRGKRGRNRRGLYRGGYRIPWDQLDLADPSHPRLRCSVEELEALEPDE